MTAQMLRAASKADRLHHNATRASLSVTVRVYQCETVRRDVY